MTTGMYDKNRTTTATRSRYEERRLLMSERFYPGEFGWVVVLGIASLLVFSVAIWGVTNDTKPNPVTINAFQGYGTASSSGLTTNPTGTSPNGEKVPAPDNGNSGNGAGY